MTAQNATHSFTSQKDHRKQQLIDATIQCISKHGLSSTTLAKVTKIAGLSGGIVNFYFDSKEQLLLGTLEAISQEYEQIIGLAFEFSDDPKEILADVVRAHFDPQICTPEKIAVWYAFASESHARQEYMSICEQHDADFQRSLLKVISLLCKSQAAGNLNPVAISRGLEGLIDGYWQEYLYKPQDFDADTAISVCQDYLSAFFSSRDESSTAKATVIPPDQSTTDLLAPWTYYNEEFHQLEIDQLFKRQWLLAGHVSEIPEPRDYLTFDAVGERALVLRGNNNEVRAFHNVCRHRGAKLVENNRGQCCSALTCPFHGWTYQLDGRLLSIPAFETFDGVVKADNGLVALDVEIWMGFIFVRFCGEGPSMAQTMKPVEHLIAPYRIAEMQSISGRNFRYLRPYNWKVIHDIDNEGYHVPIGHPSLNQLYGRNYRDDTIEDVSVSFGYLNDQPGKLWSVRHYQNLLPRFDHLPEDCQRLWFYIGIFPSMVLAMYPDSLEFYMSIPVSTASTLSIGGAYALPDDRREVRAVRFLNARINSTTDREDENFVGWLQEGMKSSAFPEPKLSSIEQGVRQFHKKIQSVLPVANLANEPDTGMVAVCNQQLMGY